MRRPTDLDRRCGSCIVAAALVVLLSLFVATAIAADELSTEIAASEETFRPLPKEPPAPKGNPATPEKVALGKQLFFDPRLSGNNDMSCATCHLPQKSFADGLPTAKGHEGKALARNTPTILNVGHSKQFFWDGRSASLEEQSLVPIESPDEMCQDLDELGQELDGVPGYADQFQSIFGTNANRDAIAKALAAFERTLVSGPSPFDRFLAGDKQALSSSAQRGMKLFAGTAGCIRCHHGPMLSDGKLYRIGASFRDRGLGGLTDKVEDNYKFRTPSLRNVARTGPYMHDGSMKTLEEVVLFYYRGIPSATPDKRPLDVEPLLDQSYSDMPDIVAFLEALSGEAPHIEPPQLP